MEKAYYLPNVEILADAFGSDTPVCVDAAEMNLLSSGGRDCEWREATTAEITELGVYDS